MQNAESIIKINWKYSAGVLQALADNKANPSLLLLLLLLLSLLLSLLLLLIMCKLL